MNHESAIIRIRYVRSRSRVSSKHEAGLLRDTSGGAFVLAGRGGGAQARARLQCYIDGDDIVILLSTLTTHIVESRILINYLNQVM